MQNIAPQTEVTLVPAPKRRSGRPTADRVAEIDTAIRAAARIVFLDSGFEAASMDAVAAAAHVSKGTLYARYRSKEALFRAVIDDLLAKLSARAGEHDHLLPDDLETRLRHHAAVLISVFEWEEYVLATRLVLNAAHAFPEIGVMWQETGTKRYVQLIAADIEQHEALLTDGSANPLFLANLFLHAIAGWYRIESANGAVSEIEAAVYCNNVVAVIMAAIKQR